MNTRSQRAESSQDVNAATRYNLRVRKEKESGAIPGAIQTSQKRRLSPPPNLTRVKKMKRPTPTDVPRPKGPLPLSVALSKSNRTTAQALHRLDSSTFIRSQKVMANSHHFQIDETLEELRAQINAQGLKKAKHKINDMLNLPSQVLSSVIHDKSGQVIFVYFGDSIHAPQDADISSQYSQPSSSRSSLEPPPSLPESSQGDATGELIDDDDLSEKRFGSVPRFSAGQTVLDVLSDEFHEPRSPTSDLDSLSPLSSIPDDDEPNPEVQLGEEQPTYAHISQQYAGRTEEDLQKAKDNGMIITRDGLKEEDLIRWQYVTQHYHSVHRPFIAKKDIRHPNHTRGMEYQAHKDQDKLDSRQGIPQGGDALNFETVSEFTGLVHFGVWTATGHSNGPAVPTKHTLGDSAKEAMAVRYYYTGTTDLSVQLGAMFRAAFPQEYQQYRKAFEAGNWVPEDPGPWMCRAIIYKLQVEPHADAHDAGPTACFPLGQFSGGELYVPQLGMKLAYKPGHVALFMSSSLYHSIGDWKAVGQKSVNDVTPGRIGHVFFTHSATLKLLQDKPPGWNINTLSGNRPPALPIWEDPKGKSWEKRQKSKRGKDSQPSMTKRPIVNMRNSMMGHSVDASSLFANGTFGNHNEILHLTYRMIHRRIRPCVKAPAGHQQSPAYFIPSVGNFATVNSPTIAQDIASDVSSQPCHPTTHLDPHPASHSPNLFRPFDLLSNEHIVSIFSLNLPLDEPLTWYHEFTTYVLISRHIAQVVRNMPAAKGVIFLDRPDLTTSVLHRRKHSPTIPIYITCVKTLRNPPSAEMQSLMTAAIAGEFSLDFSTCRKIGNLILKWAASLVSATLIFLRVLCPHCERERCSNCRPSLRQPLVIAFDLFPLGMPHIKHIKIDRTFRLAGFALHPQSSSQLAFYPRPQIPLPFPTWNALTYLSVDTTSPGDPYYMSTPYKTCHEILDLLRRMPNLSRLHLRGFTFLLSSNPDPPQGTLSSPPLPLHPLQHLMITQCDGYPLLVHILAWPGAVPNLKSFTFTSSSPRSRSLPVSDLYDTLIYRDPQESSITLCLPFVSRPVSDDAVHQNVVPLLDLPNVVGISWLGEDELSVAHEWVEKKKRRFRWLHGQATGRAVFTSVRFLMSSSAISVKNMSYSALVLIPNQFSLIQSCEALSPVRSTRRDAEDILNPSASSSAGMAQIEHIPVETVTAIILLIAPGDYITHRSLSSSSSRYRTIYNNGVWIQLLRQLGCAPPTTTLVPTEEDLTPPLLPVEVYLFVASHIPRCHTTFIRSRRHTCTFIAHPHYGLPIDTSPSLPNVRIPREMDCDIETLVSSEEPDVFDTFIIHDMDEPLRNHSAACSFFSATPVTHVSLRIIPGIAATLVHNSMGVTLWDVAVAVVSRLTEILEMGEWKRVAMFALEEEDEEAKVLQPYLEYAEDKRTIFEACQEQERYLNDFTYTTGIEYEAVWDYSGAY
ncbi:hypothetical protein JAAARDRAFT_51809 [Jaapia argillacea MUCL 33604]|uniref:Uncharacterized protein n=1 Tax=Jaapia argillacea MUCL 33604 TaxID=933084 RepID=A0A067P2V6_9AGAM|nr:hypothetical protein JAAARDRAFT_51809 [Jaapia argillacea MUCL 33604]